MGGSRRVLLLAAAVAVVALVSAAATTYTTAVALKGETKVIWVKPRSPSVRTPRRAVPVKLLIKRAKRGATYDITVRIEETADGASTVLLDETRTVEVVKPR